MLQTTVAAFDSRRDRTKIRLVSYSSDGEARRHKALVDLTFVQRLPRSSPIFDQINFLRFMDDYVGEDDVTCDKDYKHVVFKRL